MKKLLTTLLSVSVISTSLLSAESGNINSAISSTIDGVKDYTVQNTSMLILQPEAYIEKLFPALPPHFTAGISASGTIIDTGFFTDATKSLIKDMNTIFGQSEATKNSGINISDSLDIPSKIFMPAAALSARIGGIGLPFDFGAFGITTFNILDNINVSDYKISLNYTAFGFDFRYQTVEDSGLKPSVSFGLGYIYTKHSFGAEGSMSKNLKYTISGTDYNFDTKLNTDIDADITTHSLYFSAQVSKKIAIFTPFIGGKLFITADEYSYSWKYNTSCSEASEKGASLPSNSGSDSGKDGFDFNHIQPQIFAGLGLKLGLFQLGLDAAWNPVSNLWSFGTQFNFKL